MQRPGRPRLRVESVSYFYNLADHREASIGSLPANLLIFSAIEGKGINIAKFSRKGVVIQHINFSGHDENNA
jgi:hypothetical protein